ncbi:MAG: hypothetical protein CMJ42_20650 [Phyllobacteriaceae bacterium]|nr:hypothetical protein [Phyllobacteriaceae bacterium]MBA90745.1 hypothetical protein [Phyllobacteriaceae bacterium]
MMQLLRLASLTFMLLAAVLPVSADPRAILENWYAALQAGDETAVSALLAEDAVFVLEDIGIEQTRKEFLESLPEWREAIRGGSLQWKLLEPGNPATALVCYRFADSEAEVREVFTFSGERIARSLQTENGERCEGF